MTEVVSIKFKNRGKPYFFDPAGLELEPGEHVLVDTAGGMEMGVVSRENHAVEDTAVVQPLRRVLRKATQMDLRTEDLIRQREESAMKICREKIAEHKLDMKLVDVECNFEGSKTTFFFTSDGRVDFRALVKDLAAVLHTRIELRQIGVRDEAKMLGGLGICGRPYCCSQFLDDFRPVSTKMAKVQSLSLNPAKISGSCGRLLCCLRYEQEAYEDLVKKVPKQGAFVETKDGYGTAVQVNLLRSTVKVRLDDDRDDVLHEYQANELAAVPGGRPKDGSEPPHVSIPPRQSRIRIPIRTLRRSPAGAAAAETARGRRRPARAVQSPFRPESRPQQRRRKSRLLSGRLTGSTETAPEATAIAESRPRRRRTGTDAPQRTAEPSLPVSRAETLRRKPAKANRRTRAKAVPGTESPAGGTPAARRAAASLLKIREPEDHRTEGARRRGPLFRHCGAGRPGGEIRDRL